MTLKLIATPEAPPARIDTNPEARKLAGLMGASANRVSGLIGRAWTTQESVDRAKADCLEIAEQALALIRVLG
jgi:hypothetical protein